MTIEQKVGQLFMVGFPQPKLDPSTRALISDYKIGNFILFKRNISSVQAIRDLNSELTKITRHSTGVSPLLAVDQEGGSVVRLQVQPPLPPALSLGLAGDEDLTKAFGEETGALLNWVGFNMNLAPVLDLADPLRPSFLGTRSFGAEPLLVSKMGMAYSQGLLASHVIPTAKHFPGLGSSIEDPHHIAVTRIVSSESFFQRDLDPFLAFSKLGVGTAMMISQMSYPALDPSGVPAPFSKRILTDLLRVRMGYEGLIITDDLQMKASSLVLPPDEASLESLRAGADIVMVTWSISAQKKAVERVLRAVREGEFSRTLLDQKVQRILTAKAKLSEAVTSEEKTKKKKPRSLYSRRLASLDLEVLDRNLQKTLSDVPWKRLRLAGQSRICVASPFQNFLNSFSKSAISKSVHVEQIQAQSKTTDLIQSWHKQSCDLIVFSVAGKKTRRLLAQVPAKTRAKILLVNLGHPSDATGLRGFFGTLQIGFHHHHAGLRIAQLLEQRLAVASR